MWHQFARINSVPNWNLDKTRSHVTDSNQSELVFNRGGKKLFKNEKGSKREIEQLAQRQFFVFWSKNIWMVNYFAEDSFWKLSISCFIFTKHVIRWPHTNRVLFRSINFKCNKKQKKIFRTDSTFRDIGGGVCSKSREQRKVGRKECTGLQKLILF